MLAAILVLFLVGSVSASWRNSPSFPRCPDAFTIAIGTFKWLDESEGFGFITPDGGGEDLFAHCSVIQRRLHDSTECPCVRFDVTAGQKGRQTSNIRPAE